MASASASKKMWEEATCSICLHLMAEPVSISCGHSYCQACLRCFMGQSSSWNRQTFSCPQCRAPFWRGDLRSNWELGSLIAEIWEQEQQQLEQLELELELEQEKQQLEQEQELSGDDGNQNAGNLSHLYPVEDAE